MFSTCSYITSLLYKAPSLKETNQTKTSHRSTERNTLYTKNLSLRSLKTKVNQDRPEPSLSLKRLPLYPMMKCQQPAYINTCNLGDIMFNTHHYRYLRISVCYHPSQSFINNWYGFNSFGVLCVLWEHIISVCWSQLLLDGKITDAYFHFVFRYNSGIFVGTY